MNAFFIIPTSVKARPRQLFATHPPMEKRLERLSVSPSPAPGRSRLASWAFGKHLRRQEQLSAPAPDRLFALSTAYVHLETALGSSTAAAGIVFQSLGTADFGDPVRGRGALKGTAEETGSTLRPSDDEFGYRWLVLEDPDFDGPGGLAEHRPRVVLQAGGYGDRPLASAVFAFEEGGHFVYLIYNLARARSTCSVPAGESCATLSASCAQGADRP
ncbi:MAG: hypothetical protein WKF31_13255 [Thermoleophilaceae bacterium]